MKRPRIGDAEDHVSDAAVGAGTQLVQVNTLLMVVRGMILAHTFPVALTTAPVTFNQDIKALVPRNDLLPEFLLYLLQQVAPDILKMVDVANHGTKRLPTERLWSTPVPLPSHAEQQKIAAILSSVDDVIEKSEAVIAQLQVVKKAMMQQLLTRGVPGRHTLFKTTAVGELPAEWKVVPLGEALCSIEAGWSPQCEQRAAVGDEWGVLKISAVTWGEFKPNENKKLPDGLTPRPEIQVRVGDVLMSRANTPDLVGRAVIVRQHCERMMLSDKLLRLRPRDGVALGAFLNLLLSSPGVRSQVTDGATGSSKSMKNISQANLREVTVPLPPLDEQDSIVLAVDSIVDRERVERHALHGLRNLKTALASALLTGELRVLVDQEVAA